MTPIGTVRSCWPTRFGIPRQPTLVPAATATLELDARVPPAAFTGLDGWSHLWVVFVFHGVEEERWTVRPPRLGGSARRGVYATRSPHRPNRIGLSLVEIVAVDAAARTVTVRGHDLLDGTPILDLKPYVPYAEAVPDARAGWAEGPVPRVAVRFEPTAAEALADAPELRALIEQTFALDPRPAGSTWTQTAVRIDTLDVHAERDDDGWRITLVRPWDGEGLLPERRKG